MVKSQPVKLIESHLYGLASIGLKIDLHIPYKVILCVLQFLIADSMLSDLLKFLKNPLFCRGNLIRITGKINPESACIETWAPEGRDSVGETLFIPQIVKQAASLT